MDKTEENTNISTMEAEHTKVIKTNIKSKIMTLIKHTQGLNAENADELDSSPPNKTHQKVNNPINPVNELQTMDGNETMEDAHEEGDVSLNCQAGCP